MQIRKMFSWYANDLFEVSSSYKQEKRRAEFNLIFVELGLEKETPSVFIHFINTGEIRTMIMKKL